MDKALVGEQAMAAFRRALDADPSHRTRSCACGSCSRRTRTTTTSRSLLAKRLDVETDARAQIELHRALAELHRNFLVDRETAKHALPRDPRRRSERSARARRDRRHRVGAGHWQEAADALMARARLEREPEILKTLCFRLGLIYADRLVDVPMALKAFQRALTYQPDDENTLVRLADLATQAGEWKLALGACERLVKSERGSGQPRGAPPPRRADLQERLRRREARRARAQPRARRCADERRGARRARRSSTATPATSRRCAST